MRGTRRTIVFGLAAAGSLAAVLGTALADEYAKLKVLLPPAPRRAGLLRADLR